MGSQRGSNRRTRPSGDRGTRLGGVLVRYSGPCGNQLIEPGRRRPEIRRGGNLGVGAATGEGKCAGGGILGGVPEVREKGARRRWGKRWPVGGEVEGARRRWGEGGAPTIEKQGNMEV
jgi:hypothetical protein